MMEYVLPKTRGKILDSTTRRPLAYITFTFHFLENYFSTHSTFHHHKRIEYECSSLGNHLDVAGTPRCQLAYIIIFILSHVHNNMILE